MNTSDSFRASEADDLYAVVRLQVETARALMHQSALTRTDIDAHIQAMLEKLGLPYSLQNRRIAEELVVFLCATLTGTTG